MNFEKLKLEKNDVLIIRNYDDFDIESLIKGMDSTGLDNLVLFLDEKTTIETMTEEELQTTLETVIEKRKNEKNTKATEIN